MALGRTVVVPAAARYNRGMTRSPLLITAPAGLYCEAGDFYIDPWRAVPRAIITHAHSDHARRGMGEYVCARDGAAVLATRVGEQSRIVPVDYGQRLTFRDVIVSLHPAGHILGSSQVRIEHRGEVWCVSGDYKTQADRTCQPFELVQCHTFVTESTFGLPIYRWQPQQTVFSQINDWWQRNRDDGVTSVLFGYSLGKAQRLLGGVDPTIGPIVSHGAAETMNGLYRAAGIALPPTVHVAGAKKSPELQGALVIGPQSVQGTGWLNRFGDVSLAFASGWMAVRGTRRRSALDRGFVLSDHADWSGLLGTIEATGAERILVTHGQVNVLVRWLSEHGHDAAPLHTQFVGEAEDAGDTGGSLETGVVADAAREE